MMNRLSTYPIILFLFLFSLTVNAQQTGEWMSIKLKFDLPKGFSAGLTEELRTYHPGLQVDQLFLDAELGYKINKRFDVSVNYRYSRKREEHSYLYPRYRWYFDLGYDNGYGRFSFDTRIRLQRQTTSYWEDSEDLLPEIYLRDKFTISYNLPKTKKEPFLSFELFYPMNAPKKFFDAYRITAGIEAPLNKKQEIEVGIMYEREYLPVYASFINLLFSYSFEIN